MQVNLTKKKKILAIYNNKGFYVYIFNDLRII